MGAAVGDLTLMVMQVHFNDGIDPCADRKPPPASNGRGTGSGEAEAAVRDTILKLLGGRPDAADKVFPGKVSSTVVATW